MIRSLFTGVSGLKQFQTKMDVLSNNIANVNTTGFKRGRVMFQDQFCETLKYGQQSFGDYGSLNPQQVGLGVRTAAIDTLMDQGHVESTGKTTDVAIDGNGFFIAGSYDGCTYYTRDGNFNVSDSHDLIMANTGYKINGWPATQNPVTGNLEMKETGVVPTAINIAKYLKKHAHQTNEIMYSCNLDSESEERDIEMNMNTLTFKDSTGAYQNLTFKFEKLSSTDWIWSATDDSEGTVATGTLKSDEDGKLIESTVEPEGVGSSTSSPFFTYDPDGTPQPATSTMPVNAISNAGNGISSGVLASGTLVKDESIQIIFDGGDPDCAASYRVVGSERGYIGSGTLSGEQARIKGEPVNAFNTDWNVEAATSFDITDGQGTPAPKKATISFAVGHYTPAQIVDTINDQMAKNGVRATAYFDSVTRQFQIVSNDVGSNKNLNIDNVTGQFADLAIPEGEALGSGASKAEIFCDTGLAAANSDEWDPENDRWDVKPTVEGTAVHLRVSDGTNEALITFDDIVAGVNQIYSRGAILAEINSQLAQNNVNATASFIDTNDNGSLDQLVITHNKAGSGEKIYLSGTNIAQLGLTTGTYAGTAAISHFNYGGLEFTLTEGNKHWLPNETMSFETTAEKGASDSVNIMVPQPAADSLVFSATVNGDNYKIEGAISKGATHSTNIIAYDSLGTAHGIVTTWEHTNSETMEWCYKVAYSDDDPEILAWLKNPANNVQDPDKPTKDDYERANDALIQNREGKLYFYANGKINQGKSVVPIFSCKPEGSNEINVTLDTELITQFASDFTTKAENQDGYEMGLLEEIYFENDGIIRGVYSNGQKQPIAQLALVSFNNPMGLEKMGDNLYAFAPSSGLPVVGKAGIGRVGVIVPSSLEMSNVDISEEFTNMIVTERAFQANSRVITTSDEMLQEVVNLKR